MSDVFSKPKTDLHAHMALSAPFWVYESLRKVSIKKPDKVFPHLHNFLQYLNEELLPTFSEEDALTLIFRESLQTMIKAGVNFTEMSIDLHCAFAGKKSWEELVQECQSEIDKVADKITVIPELGVRRESDEVFWRKEVPKALSTNFFRSLDLYGNETAHTVDHYMDYFNWGRDRGLKIKFHVGEIGDPEQIYREVKKINPDAIQHGVRASEDPKVMEMLANRGININVCPTSNVCLSVSKDYKTHPIRKLFDAGCRVTLNSDDYAVFGVTAADEYKILHRENVFSEEELEAIRIYGLMARTFYD